MKPEIQGVILAGGLGTRLGALCENLPKPMIQIGGKPFLAYLIDQCRCAGITDIILCVSHCGEVIRDYFGEGDSFGVRLRYTTEPERRGTAGAIKLAEQYITSDMFLAMNGDSFCSVDIPQMFREHQDHGGIATLALVEVENAGRYGFVEMDESRRIVRFAEKSTAAHGYISGGVYACSRRLLGVIPAGINVSIEYDVFARLAGHDLYGFPGSGYFIDIGTPENYEKLARDPSRIKSAVK